MAVLKNRWVILSMLLACWSLTATFLAGYFWYRYTDIENRIVSGLIYVSLGIDYGNGTREWHNDTKAFGGETLFDVTKRVANVTYEISLYGTQVTAINNVSKQRSFGWTYWVLDGMNQTWSIVWDNVDAYKLADQETFMWYFQNGFNPPE